MTLSKVCGVLSGLKCATALEVAEKLGMTRNVAQMYLNRLVARGVVEKRRVGNRAVIYCIRHESCPPDRPRRVVRRGGAYRLYTATRERLMSALEMLQREPCVSVGTLMRMLGATHNETYYMLRVMLMTGKGVKVVIGNTAVLCRDRAAAEEAVSMLRMAVHRLAATSGMRYATASKILRAALRDRDTYELLSKFVVLRRNMRVFPPAALAFISAVLESLYGEPLRYGRRRVYVVAPQPRAEHGIEIADSVETHVVRVSLPDDLAIALRDADANEIVLQALEQALRRYRP